VSEFLTQKRQKGITLWFTGLSGSGKTTIAIEVERILKAQDYKVERLDGDEVRKYLCRDLGFSKEDRDENIRRVSYLAKLLTRNDVITLCCFVSPYRAAREKARALIDSFAEIYVNTPLAVCEERDVKGLYARARAGEIPAFTGVSDPYEPPINPEIEILTNQQELAESVAIIINYLNKNSIIL
jgi:adenylylsulfate kinase